MLGYQAPVATYVDGRIELLRLHAFGALRVREKRRGYTPSQKSETTPEASRAICPYLTGSFSHEKRVFFPYRRCVWVSTFTECLTL